MDTNHDSIAAHLPPYRPVPYHPAPTPPPSSRAPCGPLLSQRLLALVLSPPYAAPPGHSHGPRCSCSQALARIDSPRAPAVAMQLVVSATPPLAQGANLADGCPPHHTLSPASRTLARHALPPQAAHARGTAQASSPLMALAAINVVDRPCTVTRRSFPTMPSKSPLARDAQGASSWRTAGSMGREGVRRRIRRTRSRTHGADCRRRRRSRERRRKRRAASRGQSRRGATRSTPHRGW